MDDLKANVTSQFEGKYKKIDLTGALEEIEKSSGTQFDPEVVEAFRHVVSTYMEEQEHVSV